MGTVEDLNLYLILLLATPKGLEPSTSSVTGLRTNHLYYGIMQCQVDWLGLLYDASTQYKWDLGSTQFRQRQTDKHVAFVFVAAINTPSFAAWQAGTLP